MEPGSQRSSPLLVPGILEKLLPQEFLKAYVYLRLPLKLLSRIMQRNVLLLNSVANEMALQFLGHRFVIRECYQCRKVVIEILLLITEILLTN